MNTLMSIVYCIVGCNTGADDKQALHVLACDTETGAAKIVQSVKGVQGTTYFQIDRTKKNLYTMIGENGKGVIVKFALDGHTIGKMTRLVTLPCETPCHIALTPDETRVAFACYGSATCGTVRIDGTDLKTFTFPDDDMGDNKLRQKKAYAHQVFFVPWGNAEGAMGVVDLGCDRVWFFDPVTMERRERLDIKGDKGDGPRHGLFPPPRDARISMEKCFYLLNELESSVSTYAFNGASFKRLQKISMLPEGFNRWDADGETLVTKAAAIKTTADNEILMASNRGYDSIAFYTRDNLGCLQLKNIAKLTGKFPRDFALFPGEKFMVVGHKMSDEIQIYRFDRTACTLTPVGTPIPCYHPLCFQFL